MVKLMAGGQPQWRSVTSSRGYLSASELPVTFGLGAAHSVESVEVTWPDGTKQAVMGVIPGRMTTVEQMP